MSFVPDDFEIPNHVRTDGFEMRRLTMVDLAKDLEAYMSSIDHLQGRFDPTRAPWPTRDPSH